MSARLRELFARAREEGRALFIPYVTAGYPARGDTVPILLGMEAGGADVIEMGMPFTDPMADGATVQHANEVAIQHGITLSDCFAMVREARAEGLQAPVLFMGYVNPILAMGEGRVALEARDAGVDGFIIVDLPPEEAGGFLAACRANDLSFVPLVAPTTSDERIEKLSAVGDAFLYVVSQAGTTGSRARLSEELPALVARIRKHASLPLAVGFGVSTREHVAQVSKLADAAVVGSAIISAIDAAGSDRAAQGVREYVEDVSGQ